MHPDLVTRLERVFGTLLAQGTPLFVVQGVRTLAQQQLLYQQGRTLPGRIVTYCDGTLHRSNHQVRGDGWGHAVDCAFTGNTPFADSEPWQAYGDAVVAQGLIWGGHFSLVDCPHAELA